MNNSRIAKILLITLIIVLLPILVRANSTEFIYLPMVLNRYTSFTETPIIYTPTATESPIVNTPTATESPIVNTPTVTESPSVTYYLCHIDSDHILSTESCSSGNVFAGITEFDYTTTLAGDINGTVYEFAFMMGTEGGGHPSVDAYIILDQGGSETVLASTNFVISQDDLQLYTDSVIGLNPASSSGDGLILRLVNNGLGTMILRWGSDYSEISIPAVE